VIAGQLSLEDPAPRTRRHVTFASRGLGRGDRIPPGPARLLRRLVKRGLAEDAIPHAAALVLLLDADARLFDPRARND
jgi:hypothetical protein